MPFINIMLPVYNEECRLADGVRGTVAYLSAIGYKDYEITILDNASTDKTPMIGAALAHEYTKVRYLRTEKKGVGAAIRKGAACNRCPVVGYMDIDLSTDVSHLQDVIAAFSSGGVHLVNGSRLSRGSVMQGRKWYRCVMSHGLVWLLKLTLDMKANDAICGFKFFSKSALDALIRESGTDSGWFFVIELLLRAERHHYAIVELPVRWKDDPRTTVHIANVVRNYLVNIWMLRRQFRREGIL